MFVKICGLNTEEAVQVAVDAGADALGFVFAESSRQVTPARAVELAKNLPAGVAKVAVMLHPTADEWNAVRDEFVPDWLQTDADDFADINVPDHIGCFRCTGTDLQPTLIMTKWSGPRMYCLKARVVG